LDPLEAVAILSAGVAAGAINAVVGSGTLITFPVLIGLGYQPLIANVSNNIGLVPGAIAGVHGYRRELAGQRARVLALSAFSLLGGIAGATLLLVLPASAFDAIVPVLIAFALVLVVAQPGIDRRLGDHPARREHGLAVRGAITACGAYGGYFGAGQGILLMGILGIGLRDTLQRLNGLKNVLAGLVNLVAGVIFVLATEVDWGVVALIAVGSTVGGAVGARYGRLLDEMVLRAFIVVVGTAAIVRLVAG
jgi:uncharacterized membrane protein YfcA